MPDFHDALSSGYPFVDSVHRRRPLTSHFSMRPKMPLAYVLSAGASCKCVIKEYRWRESSMCWKGLLMTVSPLTIRQSNIFLLHWEQND